MVVVSDVIRSGRAPLLAGLLPVGLLLAAVVAAPAETPAPAESSQVPLDEALGRLAADDILVADAAVVEIVSHGSVAVDALLGLVDDPRRDVRAGAIRGLGLIGDERAAAPLGDLLRESLADAGPDTQEDRYIRILAIQALGRVGAVEETELLREATAGDAFERAHAAVSLFLLDDETGYDLVRVCLADTAMAIRNLVVEGLGNARTPAAKDLILAATRDESWVVRDTAYRALRHWLAEDDVALALRAGVDDPSWFVRETIAEMRSGTRATGPADR